MGENEEMQTGGTLRVGEGVKGFHFNRGIYI